jgi:hypothetical protein
MDEWFVCDKLLYFSYLFLAQLFLINPGSETNFVNKKKAFKTFKWLIYRQFDKVISRSTYLKLHKILVKPMVK